jgi:hypothetical protein
MARSPGLDCGARDFTRETVPWKYLLGNMRSGPSGLTSNGTFHFMTYGDHQLVIKFIPVVCSGLFSVDEWFPNWGTEFPREALHHDNR